MNLIYLSLGSNLGSRLEYLDEAVKLIQSRIGGIDKVSRYYESEPWGFSSKNHFYNCCLSLFTSLDPVPLMDKLLEIEQDMGRIRIGAAYSDRVIDIDMLFYGDRQLDHPRLKLPHPSIGDRMFVLAPLAEIAPGFIHPVTGMNIREMLQACSDSNKVVPVARK